MVLTKRALICFMLSLLFSADAMANADNDQPPTIGNFALPASQQPAAFITFGQNIIAKHETEWMLFASDYAGINKHAIGMIPAVLYGMTDRSSILISVPYAISNQTNNNKSAGFEDSSVQLEYAFYSTATHTHTDQATIVANMTFPTGSSQKNPPTGVGSPSYFLGTTFNRTYVDWFFYASPGVIVPTSKNNTKFGNSYLYQGGMGKNISDSNGWIIAWLAELDGTYSQGNKVAGVIDPNSGGNIIYAVPSLWASTEKFIFQIGFGVPMSQHAYGNQTNSTYFVAANVAWSIY